MAQQAICPRPRRPEDMEQREDLGWGSSWETCTTWSHACGGQPGFWS